MRGGWERGWGLGAEQELARDLQKAKSWQLWPRRGAGRGAGFMPPCPRYLEMREMSANFHRSVSRRSGSVRRALSGGNPPCTAPGALHPPFPPLGPFNLASAPPRPLSPRLNPSALPCPATPAARLGQARPQTGCPAGPARLQLKHLQPVLNYLVPLRLLWRAAAAALRDAAYWFRVAPARRGVATP